MILRELWIGPYHYEVKYEDGLEEFGVHDNDPPTITIRDGLEGVVLVDTLLHEITHAINCMWWLEKPSDERLARVYGTSWTQIFAANPELLDWIKHHLSTVGSHGASGARRRADAAGWPIV